MDVSVFNQTKTLTDEEWHERDELYRFVKDTILGYEPDQALSRGEFLALEGLRYGKDVETGYEPDVAKYPYKIILYSFKMNKAKIEKAIKEKEFKNATQRMVYICRIAERDLNGIYERMKKQAKSIEKTEEADISVQLMEMPEYKKRDNDNKIGNKLKELW